MTLHLPFHTRFYITREYDGEDRFFVIALAFRVSTVEQDFHEVINI